MSRLARSDLYGAAPTGRASLPARGARAIGARHSHASLGDAAELERLQRALETVAELVLQDAVYAPIFRRLEEEIALEEARSQDDILARARGIVRQNASGSISARTMASDPP